MEKVTKEYILAEANDDINRFLKSYERDVNRAFLYFHAGLIEAGITCIGTAIFAYSKVRALDGLVRGDLPKMTHDYDPEIEKKWRAIFSSNIADDTEVKRFYENLHEWRIDLDPKKNDT
jgi:hypothetical protein